MKTSAAFVAATVKAGSGIAARLAGMVAARATSNKQAFPRIAQSLQLAAQTGLEPAKLAQLLNATRGIIHAITTAATPTAPAARPEAAPATAASAQPTPGGTSTTAGRKPPKKKK